MRDDVREDEAAQAEGSGGSGDSSGSEGPGLSGSGVASGAAGAGVPAEAGGTSGGGAAPGGGSAAPPTHAGAPAARPRSLWPQVLGVLSIVFGGVWAIASLFVMLSVALGEGLNLMTSQGAQPAGSGPASSGQTVDVGVEAAELITSGMQLALTGLLIFAAVKLLARVRGARALYLVWGYATLASLPAGLAIHFALGSTPFAGSASEPMFFTVVALLPQLAFVVGVPIIVVVWFNRRSIREEVGEWPARADGRPKAIRDAGSTASVRAG